jgi:hypothetical protein
MPKTTLWPWVNTALLLLVLVGGEGAVKLPVRRSVWRKRRGRGCVRSHGPLPGWPPLRWPSAWHSPARFPAGSLNATPGALYFTAGPNDETDGLLGDIGPAQS